MSVFGLFRTIFPSPCIIFAESFFNYPLSYIPIRFFFNFMSRFLLDFSPKATLKNLHTSSNSVEINSVRMSFALPDAHCAIGRRASRPLTHFNNKNRCPTSAGTRTLLCQIPMYHPLNPLKSVPPLGHLSLKKGYISPGTNLNVLNFMSVLNSPPRRALRHWPSSLSTRPASRLNED